MKKKTRMKQNEKVALLTADFLDRDQTTFVKIRRTGRLGWESLIPQGSPYSDYMLSPASEEELLKNSFRLAEDMIKIMDTPMKVRVRISPDSSRTDGRTVWIATEVFDDDELPIGNRIDTFLGLAIHEGCHVLYTDFEACRGEKNKIVKFIENILEDERIERELGECKPGLANFLKASKYYYFDRYVQKMADKPKNESQDKFTRLLNSIISLVRYPKTININDCEEFADVLLDIRDLLLPYPSSTTECLITAHKIYELIKKYISESGMKESEQESGEQSCDITGSSKQKESQTKASDSQKAEEQMNEIFEKIEEALKSLTTDPEKNSIGNGEQCSSVQADRNLLGKVCDGRAEKGSQNGCVIYRGTPYKEKYNNSLARVRQYIPAISKSLRNTSQEYKLIHRGMRNGFLDTGKIAEAYQGVSTVYIKEGYVKSDKIAVCILIDESGSMYGDGETAARDTAVLLNEAIGTLHNVDLYIYGHSTDGGTALYIYREKDFRPKYALGSTDSRWGNNDGTAIREAATRVRKHTKENCLFFMISDGAPNESVETVRQAVIDVEKQGFSILAVSIDPQYDPSLMYKRNVNFSNLSRLAIDLGKIVRKAIADNTKRQIA